MTNKSKFESIKDSISSKVSSIGNSADEIIDEAKEGVTSLFSSDTVDEINTTHYICVPDPLNLGKYLVLTKREVSGNVKENSLPTKRIFHVHKEEAISVIRSSMMETESNSIREQYEKDAFSGDPLVNVANHIDKANEKISSGVLIAGAATCLFNPVLGVAIITKSLVPSIGAKVASELLGSSGNSINKWSKDNVDAKVEKSMDKVQQSAEPVIEPNIILYKIDKALEDRDYQPILEAGDLDSDIMLITPILKEVYGDYLGSGFFEKKVLSTPLIEYIKHLKTQYEVITNKS